MSDMKPNFRVHFSYMTGGGEQRDSWDVFAPDPVTAAAGVKAAQPSRNIRVLKTKAIREDTDVDG